MFPPSGRYCSSTDFQVLISQCCGLFQKSVPCYGSSLGSKFCQHSTCVSEQRKKVRINNCRNTQSPSRTKRDFKEPKWESTPQKSNYLCFLLLLTFPNCLRSFTSFYGVWGGWCTALHPDERGDSHPAVPAPVKPLLTQELFRESFLQLLGWARCQQSQPLWAHQERPCTTFSTILIKSWLASI